MNKVSVNCNQSIDYITYTLTLNHKDLVTNIKIIRKKRDFTKWVWMSLGMRLRKSTIYTLVVEKVSGNSLL